MLPLNNNNQAANSGYNKQVASTVMSAAAASQKNGPAYLKVLDMLTVFASKWYLFVISLGIALGICYTYLNVTPAVYTRVASIMIKNDLQSSQTQNLKFLDSNIDVNNELFTLQSPDIAKVAVSKLNLQMNYYAQGRFHEEAIYGAKMPVEINMLDLGEHDAAEFYFELRPNGTFIISRFKYGNQDLPGAWQCKVDRVVKTPIGRLEVKATNHYVPQEISLRVVRTTLSEATNHVRTHLKASAANEMTTIITLTYNDEEPQRAEDVLSAIIAAYNERWMEDSNRKSKATSEFIGERLEVIEQELGNVEDNIADFKSANLIPASSNDISSLYVGQANSANQQSNEIQNQLQMAKYVRHYLTDASNKFTLIPANQGVNSPNISSQITEYNALLRVRNDLLSASSLENPLVQEKDLQLADLRAALIASVDNDITSLNMALASAQNIRGQANEKIASSPEQSKYLLSVERQQKVKESLYLYLLQRREENNLSQAFAAYNTSVISSPTGSNVPTFPIPRNVWAMGILAGLAIPAGLLFLLEALNNKVRGRRDLSELSIPFIGEIPIHIHHRTFFQKMFDPWKSMWNNLLAFLRIRDLQEDKTLHILVKDHSRNFINEAFRVIRTNIEFMTAKGSRGKVIMMTSFNPNSGKTFVVTNLVTSFAIKRQRVLAIDLDLRKASLSAMVNKPKIGIADYLSGVTDSFEDIVVRNATHDYLDVVPVGTIPPNPTELLFDDRLAQLLESLRNQYAYILLDCPPVEIVADATIVGRYVDSTLFVIRAEKLDRSMLPDIQQYYDDNRLPKMSLILNGTTDQFSYYGYHRYGSRYGYYGGSSYGEYAKEDE